MQNECKSALVKNEEIVSCDDEETGIQRCSEDSDEKPSYTAHCSDDSDEKPSLTAHCPDDSDEKLCSIPEIQCIYAEDLVIIRRKKGVVVCERCGKVCSGSGYLRRHEKSCKSKHEKTVLKERKEKGSVKNKVVISCDECPYTCNLMSKLKSHRRTHTGEKPFSCKFCEYSCSHSSNLKVHIRSHTGEKPFACSECEYSSPQINRLKTHMRVHTGEKPYSCDLCMYSCTLAINLKTHRRTHTNEKPFICEVCNYSCRHLSNLKKHLTIHIGREFSCGSCSFKSADSALYTAHLKKHKDNVTLLLEKKIETDS